MTHHWAAFVATVCVGLTLQAPPVSGQRNGPEKTAWQKDDSLGKRWDEITGRFIFQRACLSCHSEGAGAFTRKEWETGLATFPGAAHPPLPKFYSDLTARFAPGRYVPNQKERLAALRAFVARYASQTKRVHTRSKSREGVDLLPSVGTKAPSFKIQTIDGKSVSLDALRGKRNLVLVFSRADW